MSNIANRQPVRLRTYAADLEAKKNELAQAESLATTTPAATEKKGDHLSEVVEKTNTPSHSKTVADTVPKLSQITKTEKPTVAPSTNDTIRHISPTKIPAFHELKKNVKSIQEKIVIDPKKEVKHIKKSTQKNSKTVRPNIGYDAAVITDTKSDRFKLFPSIIASIRSWLKRLAEEKKRKSIPKYTVAEADRRKGVIQQATSKTGTIFSADNETIREQIRRRQLQNEAENDEAETIWTPFTETGFSLLRAPEITPVVTQNVVVSYKKPVSAGAVIVAQADSKLETAGNLKTIGALSENEHSDADPLAEERWNAARENDTNQTPVHSENVEKEVQSLATESEATPVPKVPTTQQPRNLLAIFDTNTLTVLLLIVVICAVAIIFATRIIMDKFDQRSTSSLEITTTTKPILVTENLVNVTLSVQDLNQIPALLDSTIASQASAGLTEYALVSGVGDEVGASYLFELLGFNTMPILRQSLTAVRFASINQSRPAVLLSFVNEDAVRGGLLNWEITMPTDLRVLYNIPSTATASLTDEQIGGFDVRVLRHDEVIVLVYGIVNSNTAIIAATGEDFAQIVENGLSE